MSHTVRFTVLSLSGLALVAACGLAISEAASTSPTVTYTASGKFSTTLVSGTDIFRLAGEPFMLTISASEAAKAHAHGKGYGVYTNLAATGTVTSGLVPQSPFTLASTHTFMALALGNPQHDVVELIVPVTVASKQIRINAKLLLPHGTFTKWTIAPFAGAASLDTKDSTVSYSDGSSTSATLSIASGTLTTKVGK